MRFSIGLILVQDLTDCLDHFEIGALVPKLGRTRYNALETHSLTVEVNWKATSRLAVPVSSDLDVVCPIIRLRGRITNTKSASWPIARDSRKRPWSFTCDSVKTTVSNSWASVFNRWLTAVTSCSRLELRPTSASRTSCR